MQRFQVPQFITVEDKVIGPLSVKQALYLAAGVVLLVFMYAVLRPFLFWPLAVLVGGAAAALAFLKINSRPLPIVLKNALSYFLKPRVYIWKQAPPARSKPKETPRPEPEIKTIPKLSESKLTDLAWSLDIKSKEE